MSRSLRFCTRMLRLAMAAAVGLALRAPSPGRADEVTVVTPSGGRHSMVQVPAGPFLLGNQMGPQVTLSRAYYIDKYEVSNALYAGFVGVTGHRPSSEVGNPDLNGAEYPVVGVSFWDAQDYCRWAGLRLPTEAEWVKAARGTDGRSFPWGNEPATTPLPRQWGGPALANLGKDSCHGSGMSYFCDDVGDDSDGYLYTAPADSYPEGASPYGVYNMAGNVVEWTADWFGPPPQGVDPHGPDAPDPAHDSAKVARGSCYKDSGGHDLSWRYSPGPEYRMGILGFRCAQYADALPTAADTSSSRPDTAGAPVSTGGQGSGLTRVFALANGATMSFVWIEPGTFTMGSPWQEPGRLDNEDPPHQVTLSQGFWLGQYEITQGQWEQILGTQPWSGHVNVVADRDHPAVFVSWYDVEWFVDKLNTEAGQPLYRMPTEAEWEYACRAGTTTTWSFGDDPQRLGDYAWYYDNAWNAGLHHAQPAGTKLPNPWGLYDMHGNVREWCQDRCGPYLEGLAIDPKGPASGSCRIVRGGDFMTRTQYTRSAYRWGSDPTGTQHYVGARLVRQGPAGTAVPRSSWGAVKRQIDGR